MTTDARLQLQVSANWQVHDGARAGYLAGALGLAGFTLALLAPRDAAERASDPMWLTAALASWLSTALATVFLFGLGAAARRPSLAGRLALAIAVLSAGAGAGLHSRVLVDYAAFGIDPAFAGRLQDTQTPLAQALFAVITITAAGSWLVVASSLGRAAGISRAGRIAVGAAGLGIMLPVPLTALALLVASAALLSRRHSTGPTTATSEG